MTAPTPTDLALQHLDALAARAGADTDRDAVAQVRAELASLRAQAGYFDLAEAERTCRVFAAQDRSRLGRAIELVLGALDEARNGPTGQPERVRVRPA